jgi:threonine dehydrogenase-like Zn-dependent dehydrogenase
MRALKFTRTSYVEVVDDEPEPQRKDGDIVIEVAYAGICGSDLHGVLPGGYRKPPLIMGHEFSGITPDGRRVAVNATINCGTCDLCRRGREQVCRRRQIIGIDRPGGMAERVAVPERAIVELPEETSLLAGALVEPLAVAVRGWKRAGAEPGDRVGIVGAGNIGLLLLAVSQNFDVETTITDIDPARRQMAEAMGGKAAEDLAGEYDLVFDAVGSREAHSATLEHLAPGGTAIWIGSRSPDPAFDALDLVRSEKTVKASFAYTHDDFVEAARLAATLDLGWVEVVDLDRSAEVFMSLMAGRSSLVKAVIRP